MAEIENRPSNFIRTIIDNDLVSGKHASTHTRFPPEPNGFLHIGHAKSICLNFGIAKDYSGLCNLRFDDTNPEKEDVDYVNAIKEDVQWLGFEWHGDINYSSNYFAQLHGYAVELIEKGLAYVCFLSPDQAREYRGTLTEAGKNSPHRDTSVEENLALFAKMKNGEFKEGECVLRAKIDMASSFMVLRDPIIYRIRFVHHHQTGDKWCIYPMYDWAHGQCDYIEQVSHSLCSLEFRPHRDLYEWFLSTIKSQCDVAGLRIVPKQREFARLNLSYTIMSKRKLAELVNSGLVEGWDDPRMPTISGLRRRGVPPESILNFCEKVGVSKRENVIDYSLLDFCCREVLNKIAYRLMVILDPIELEIMNYKDKEKEVLIAENVKVEVIKATGIQALMNEPEVKK